MNGIFFPVTNDHAPSLVSVPAETKGTTWPAKQSSPWSRRAGTTTSSSCPLSWWFRLTEQTILGVAHAVQLPSSQSLGVTVLLVYWMNRRGGLVHVQEEKDDDENE